MSRRQTLQAKQWVPYPLEILKEFFSTPSNLAQLVPPAYNAKVELLSKDFGEGSQILIEMQPFAVPARVKWLSHIQDLKQSESRFEFVDRQLKGPFAHWKHHHILEKGDSEFKGQRTGQVVQLKESGTWITDIVEYEMPLGLLGSVAEKLFARKQLEELLALRKTKILELLATQK